MPHRPAPRGYEAFDLWLNTKDSAKDALAVQDWTIPQQTHINNFTDYARINKTEDRLGHIHFRDRENGRFVTGY